MYPTETILEVYASMGIDLPIDEDGMIPYSESLLNITIERKKKEPLSDESKKKIEELKAMGIKFED